MLKFETKPVQSSFAEPWKPTKVGDSIVGVYIGAEEIPPTAAGNGKPFQSWRFRPVDVETGEVIRGTKVHGVSGAFLTSIMDQIPTGTICKVVYKGTVKSAKGNPSKQYDVFPAQGADLIDPYAA